MRRLGIWVALGMIVIILLAFSMTVEAKSLAEKDFSEEDVLILNRMGMSEGGVLAIESIQAIAQVAINRAKSDYREFACQNTIYDVVYGKAGQFSMADNGEPNDKVIFAVQSATMYPEAFPTDMLWFNSNHYPNYGYPYTEIDGMYFSTVTNYHKEVTDDLLH